MNASPVCATHPLAEIPHPPSLPFVGNLPQMITNRPLQRFVDLHRRYGPIYQLKLPGEPIFIGSQELVDQVCDETRFEKHVSPPLQQLALLGGRGLFTSETRDPMWGKASRVLTPAFSGKSMHNYFPTMLQVCESLVDCWSRAKGPIDVSADMTRLTFDTMGLCGFGYDFESFQREQPHPFVSAMNRSAVEALARVRRPNWVNKMMLHRHLQLAADMKLINETVDTVIAERRRGSKSCADSPDLLDMMLVGKDPKTGESLDDQNIREQIITFLIAGHDTSSGMLGFALFYLSRDRSLHAQARAEVDDVLGRREPRHEDLAKLDILRRVLLESLRIWPTAAMFSRLALEDVVLSDKYFVPAGQGIDVILPILHRDPKVWDEPDRFDPDRFLPERFRELPSNSYKPFGHGKRSCIGKQFALMEGTLALAMILQQFSIEAAADKPLRVVEQLTLKPDQFYLNVERR